MLELDVCRGAARCGLDLSFAATGGGALEQEFRDSGAPFYRFDRKLPVDPRVIFGLRKLVREQKFDIVHVHQPVAGIHAYLATGGMSVKHVQSFQGFIPDRKNQLVTNFLVPRMAANVSCSHGLTEWLANDGVDTDGFRMIYNGVDRARLAYDGESLREELGISPDALLFGVVAHFYPEKRKDQLTLCKAFARVAAELPEAHLIVVGRVVEGGEEMADACRSVVAEAGLEDRVHFLGQRDDLAKVVYSLDVYVFSSFYEGLPIALMEAMLSRKPCILSDIAPHLEVSQDGLYAEVFETENDAELADKLLLLGRDRTHREELAARAGEFADRTFSIEAHLESLKNLYGELLSK